MTLARHVLVDLPMALHSPAARRRLIVEPPPGTQVDHHLLAADALARPRAVFNAADLAVAAPTILVWFYALREGVAAARPADVIRFESRTNFPRVAGVLDLAEAVHTVHSGEHRRLRETIEASALLFRRLTRELTDTFPADLIESIWARAVGSLNEVLGAGVDVSVEAEPSKAVPITDLSAANREPSRQAMEAVHALHLSGFPGVKLRCEVHEGLGAWRNQIFSGPFPARGSLDRERESFVVAEAWGCRSVDALISLLQGEPSTSWRTPDPVYTTWFAEVLERTAPMGVIEMPSAYQVTTTEGVWIEPPWWPYPQQTNPVDRGPLPAGPRRSSPKNRQERVVEALIKLGKDPIGLRTGTVEEMPRTLLGSRVLWYNVEYWEALARSLPEDDLAALMRGMVVRENAGGWGCGSASPVIPLYRVYRARFSENEPELTKWIVRYRTNDYEPFGTVICPDATTWAEFLVHEEAYEADHRRRVALEDERQRIAMAEKAAKRAHEATSRLWNAVRRGDVNAVGALLSAGADWKRVVAERGSLVALANENGKAEVAELLESRGVR